MAIATFLEFQNGAKTPNRSTGKHMFQCNVLKLLKRSLFSISNHTNFCVHTEQTTCKEATVLCHVSVATYKSVLYFQIADFLAGIGTTLHQAGHQKTQINILLNSVFAIRRL